MTHAFSAFCLTSVGVFLSPIFSAAGGDEPFLVWQEAEVVLSAFLARVDCDAGILRNVREW